MQLIDLNSKGGIGSNSLYCELGPFRFVVDAGLHPKHVGREAMPDYNKIGENKLDFILLTHCHLDHLGSLPVLLRGQPQAPIICSLPTANLAPRMLRNSINVMLRQREELNIPEYPLYTGSEIGTLEHCLMPMPFFKTRVFERDGEELELTLYPAGHIVGAAGALITYKHRKIFFTGDVLFRDMRTLEGAKFPDFQVDTLVMETTRGANGRPTDYTIDAELERLAQCIAHTLIDGGSVLIPVFALGRMQEILFLIREFRDKGIIPESPIYASGLGIALVDNFDQICKKTGLVNFRKKVLHDLKVKPLERDLPAGQDLDGPAIYIASSGMLVENTPSYKVASCLLTHPRNSIAFVGYCDPDTPGGKLLATSQEEDFSFDALSYVCRVRANIERFDLSGHADREELFDFAVQAEPRAIVLTHGDPEAREWFMDEFYANPITASAQIHDPEPGEKLEV